MTISKVIVMCASPCISYQLRNINTLWIAQWYIARKEWDIDNVEVYLDLYGGGRICPPGSFFATVKNRLALDC